MSLEKKVLKEIIKILKETEKEVKLIFDESSLERPIANDIVLSKRNMAYNDIKSKIKKYIKEKEE